jgi:hypothetical protein
VDTMRDTTEGIRVGELEGWGTLVELSGEFDARVLERLRKPWAEFRTPSYRPTLTCPR